MSLGLTPLPTIEDMSEFSGHPVEFYTPADYAAQLIAQAALLLKLVTGITDWPEDPDMHKLALNGVVDLANTLFLQQPYEEIAVTPMTSETVGSHTWSKVSYGKFVQKVQAGHDTGVMWFDLAVKYLEDPNHTPVTSQSISVFETDSLYYDVDNQTLVVLGPKELNKFDISNFSTSADPAQPRK